MEAARVDHAGLDLADRERDGAGDDPLVRGLTLQPRQHLRVVDPLAVEPLGQDHGRGDERTRERASAGLVDAGDPREPLRAQAPARTGRGPRVSAAIPPATGARSITNACPITLSIGM